MKISMNSQVRVRLTPFGKARWKGLYGSKCDDVMTLTVWELMQVFGPGIRMTMTEMYFVDNEIEVIE